MNKQQEHLLILLKEIDSICKKNNIIYFTAGGTVIGAARHKGFIPWDDDVDIYMTKENFELFRKAFQNEPIKNRKLEYKEDNDKFYATIPRYNEETTTQICRYHVLGNASGGLLIDILIMDNFPNDNEERRLYLAKLNVYADLISIPYTHAQRNIDTYLDMYQYYMNKIKDKGKKAIINELEESLFNYPEDICDYYILRWAALPIVLSKQMLGTPVYLDFEDMKIPVPENWYDYLVQLYGVDWFNVPLVEGQDTHIAVSNMDISYSIFMKERNRYISQKKAYKLYFQRKRASVELEYNKRPIEAYIMNFKETLLHYKENGCEKNHIEILYQKGQYRDIVDICNEYIAKQTSVLFSGELKHISWHRWNNPWIINIDEKILHIILFSLIMVDETSSAEKIISAYVRAGKESVISSKAIDLLNSIKYIEKLYYLGNYKECILAIERFEGEKPFRVSKYLMLSKAMLTPSKDLACELNQIIRNGKEDIEIYKAYGDVLYNIGDFTRACQIYQKVAKCSQNGMFLLDISKKTNIRKVYADQSTPYKPSQLERKEELLVNEIIDICDNNNIQYVFSKGTAQRIIKNGNLGYSNFVKTIYMDAKNACKFINVVKNSNRTDRKLISWENNCNIRDFKIIYSDINSVFARLDRIEEWVGIGVHVDIIILRNKGNFGFRQKGILLLEILLNLSNLAEVDKYVLRTKKRKILYNLSGFIFKILNKNIYSRFMYNLIFSYELKQDPAVYFFRKNKEKGIYTDYTIRKDYFDNSIVVNLNNREYKISKIDSKLFKQIEQVSNISNVAPKESLFSLIVDEVNWNEILNLLDLKSFNKLPWIKYGEKRKWLSKINKKVKKMWEFVYRGGEKVELLMEEFMLKKENKNSIYTRGEIRILKRYDNKVKYYDKKNMSFFVSEGLTKKYYQYLKKHGQTKYARKLMKREKAEKYLLEKDFYEDLALRSE